MTKVFTVILVGFLALLDTPPGCCSSLGPSIRSALLRQSVLSSDGCGPNPITMLMRAMSQLDAPAAAAVMSSLENDREAWRELVTLLHEYDDCVRTGDGSRYKRSTSSGYAPQKHFSERIASQIRENKKNEQNNTVCK